MWGSAEDERWTRVGGRGGGEWEKEANQKKDPMQQDDGNKANAWALARLSRQDAAGKEGSGQRDRDSVHEAGG